MSKGLEQVAHMRNSDIVNIYVCSLKIKTVFLVPTKQFSVVLEGMWRNGHSWWECEMVYSFLQGIKFFFGK